MKLGVLRIGVLYMRLVIAFVLTSYSANGGAVPEAALSANDDVLPLSTMKANRERFCALAKNVEDDNTGRREMQSDLQKEVKKITATKPASNVVERLARLTQLSKLGARDNRRFPNFAAEQTEESQTARRIRSELLDASIIPVWSGEEWIDGTSLVFDGFEIPSKTKSAVIELNRDEFDNGWRLMPKPERERKMSKHNFTGDYRTEITMAGYVVKYDKTFDIWRITGTNGPAVKSP